MGPHTERPMFIKWMPVFPGPRAVIPALTSDSAAWPIKQVGWRLASGDRKHSFNA